MYIYATDGRLAKICRPVWNFLYNYDFELALSAMLVMARLTGVSAPFP